MKNDIELISNWFQDNNLKLNVSKTKILVIDNHNNENLKHFLGINFNGELIKREKSIKYLGLIIDEKLTWNDHVKLLKNKLISMAFAIYRINKIIPKKQLWLLYNAHFMSHLSYLNPIWNKCNEYHLNEIQILQNKIIKTIENKPKLTSTVTLYKDKLNIRNFNFLNTVTIIQKIKLNKIKCNINLNTVGNIQRTFLRNILDFRPNFFKKQGCKKSLLSNGILLYNTLPNEIKNIENINQFKNATKKYLLNKSE